MAKREQEPQDVNEPEAYEQLAAFVRQIEEQEEEKRALNEGIRDVYTEAKDVGFNTKILRKVIMKRRRDPAELNEIEDGMAEYEAALERAGSNRTTRRGKQDPLRGEAAR